MGYELRTKLAEWLETQVQRHRSHQSCHKLQQSVQMVASKHCAQIKIETQATTDNLQGDIA